MHTTTKLADAFGLWLGKNETLKELNVANTLLSCAPSLISQDGAHFVHQLSIHLRMNTTLKKLDLSNNNMFGEPDKRVITDFAKTIKDNTSITELNMSRNRINPEDMRILASALSDNRTLVYINLLNNDIGLQQARKIAVLFKEHVTLKSLCGNKGNETELDISGKKIGTYGAIMLTPEIVANGALTSLNVSDNNIGEIVAEGWTRGGYKGGGKYEWTHADGRSETCTAPAGATEGSIVLAAGIENNRALAKFTFSGYYGGEGPSVTMEASMVEADISGKQLGASGTMMLVAFLPKCQ